MPTDFNSDADALGVTGILLGTSVPVTIAQNQFLLAQNYASTAFANAETLLNSLINAAGQFNTVNTTVTLDPLTPIDTSGITSITPPVQPDLTLPPSPPITFSYVEDPYTQNILNQILTFFDQFFAGTNWGYGLSQTAQNDLMNYEKERDIITNQNAMDSIADTWGERNMMLPDLGLISGLNNVIVDYQLKELDKSRQIFEENEKLAIEQTKFAVTEASKYNAILLEYASKKNERTLQAAIASFQAGIEIYKAALEFLKTKAEIYKVEVDAYATTTEAGIKDVESQVEVYKAVAGVNVERAKLALESISLYIEELKTKVTITVEAIKGAATIAAQLTAGALSSIHASSNMSSNSSDSRSTSKSGSVNFSESHFFNNQ